LIKQLPANARTLLPISVEKWLSQAGWDVETSDKRACYLLRKKKSHEHRKNEPVYLTLSENWASLAYPLKLPLDDPLKAYQYLLEGNQRHLLGCKCALDPAGNIILAAEFPRTTLSPELLEPILNNFIDTAENYPKLKILSESDSSKAASIRPGVDIEYFIQLASIEECYLQKKLSERSLLFHYKTFFSPHDLYITASDRWLYMQMVLLNPNQNEKLSAEPKQMLILFQYLMRLNQMMYQAKLGLDNDSKVILNVEIPLRILEKKLFQDALRTLLYYTRCISRELMLVASLDKDAVMNHLAQQMLGLGSEINRI